MQNVSVNDYEHFQIHHHEGAMNLQVKFYNLSPEIFFLNKWNI